VLSIFNARKVRVGSQIGSMTAAQNCEFAGGRFDGSLQWLEEWV